MLTRLRHDAVAAKASISMDGLSLLGFGPRTAPAAPTFRSRSIHRWHRKPRNSAPALAGRPIAGNDG